MRMSDWSSDVCSSDLRPGDRRLVGYITGTADPLAVRAALTDLLPGYMVPAAVVAVPALPVTVNGQRSEERRVGKECVRTCRSRWSPYHSKKTHSQTTIQH